MTEGPRQPVYYKKGSADALLSHEQKQGLTFSANNPASYETPSHFYFV
jgi:hypothetical protein